MKELLPSIRKTLPPLKLYLEDIEFLVKRLESISDDITITTRTHEFENITEFCEVTKNPLRTLRVESRNPHLQVDLNRFSASLYLSEDRSEARGVLEQIDSYLRRRRKPLTSILISSVPTIAYLALPMFAPFFVARLFPPKFQSIGAFLLFSLSFFPLLFGLFLWRQKYTIVIPKHRSDASSFWERNWEKIAIAIVTGLITGILGFLLGWLIKFLPGPK
jgi:hypothetical protein